MNNKKSNRKNMITSTQEKIKTKSSARIITGIIVAVLVAMAIGTAIYFAGIIPPAGCQTQDDGSFLCVAREDFSNNSKIDTEKSDNWMEIKDNRLILNPAAQIKLRKNVGFSEDDKSMQQVCGTFCAPTEGLCIDGLSLKQMNQIGFGLLVKNDQIIQDNTLTFENMHLGQKNALPYRQQLLFTKDDGSKNLFGLAMVDSSNPDAGIVYNDFFGSNAPFLMPISPGRTEFRVNACGQTKNSNIMTITADGLEQYNPVGQELDTSFIQGLNVSKNFSNNLNKDYNIISADFKPEIADLPGVRVANSNTIKGAIIIIASNDGGSTWYMPAQYSVDNGQNWQQIEEGDAYFYQLNNDKSLRFEFTNSKGADLRWAVTIVSDEANFLQLRQREQQFLPEQQAGENLLPGGNGAADDFDIGMISNKIVQLNNAQNPFKPGEEVAGGILTQGESQDYYFYDPTNPEDPQLYQENIAISSLDEEVLTVDNIESSNYLTFFTDHNYSPEITKAAFHAHKVGWAKIIVTYFEPGSRDFARAEKEYGFLVLPQAYLNLDKLDIAYKTTKVDDVDGDGPGDDNDGDSDPDDPKPDGEISGTTTFIHRGANRVIVNVAGNDDLAKGMLNQAFVNNNLKLNFGTDKNNLDKNAKVYYDSKTNRYYAVLRDLKGGEKDNYNQDGFNDGRMKYYYRFSIGDKGVFLDADKKTTLGTFKTLNRKRTILYYYNWIFDRKYNLEKDYDWNKIQDGGVKYWYDTNITLPGIRFMMLNDRRFDEFNKYLNNKKKTKKLVNWLYKKVLDRIYDDNLYKFADQDGVNFWYQQMTKIRQRDRISREGVKFGISSSRESRNQLEELFESKKEANAEFSYNVVLKRGGDQSGVNYLIKTFGDSQKRMREDLANSFEYNNRLEAVEQQEGRKAAIAELYETLYARPADIAGVDYWTNTNLTIPQIKEDFLHSNEFLNVLQ